MFTILLRKVRSEVSNKFENLLSSAAIELAETERSRAFPRVRDGPKRSMLDLARTSANPDPRADFIGHNAGCRGHGVATGTHWPEMRIAKNAWFRFATVANRTA